MDPLNSGKPLATWLEKILAPGAEERLFRALGHPSPPMPDVRDRARWDSVDAAVREALLAGAAAELAEQPPRLLASSWARTYRDGNRGDYESAVRRLRERTAVLVLAAVLTGECAPAQAPPGACPHLDGAIDGIVLLAEASSWCWAPHEFGASERGELIPDPEAPYLDLGAAEAASLLAWADHALGPHLDVRMPGLRRRIRREVDARVLRPFEQVRDWPWLGTAEAPPNNWSPWIHGAVLAAALLLCGDAGRRAGLVRLAVEGLDRYVAALPADGSIDEGIAYWWQGPCRLFEALDLLAAAGGPELDARGLPVLGALLGYPERMHLGGDWYVNAGDASARLAGEQPWQVPYRWGLRLGLPGAAAHAAAGAHRSGRAVHPGAGLGRALAELADGEYRAAAAAPPGRERWLPAEHWLPGTGLLVAREEAGRTRGLALAAKAGHNGESHNHLDVGGYWLALDGRPLVVDVGRPTYTVATFGPRRYEAWPMRSDWHNVPEPGGGQRPGAEYGARDVELIGGGCEDGVGDGGGVGLSAELSGAYPEGLVDGWRRTVRLVRARYGVPAEAVVEDVWRGCRGAVLLRHVLAGSVEFGEGWALVGDGGRRLRAVWDHRLAEPLVERREVDDPLLRRSWGGVLTRLTLRVRGREPDGRLAVRWGAAEES